MKWKMNSSCYCRIITFSPQPSPWRQAGCSVEASIWHRAHRGADQCASLRAGGSLRSQDQVSQPSSATCFIFITFPCSAWLYRLCRGEDSEPVRVRTLPQSIGCGKEFPKKHRLTTAKQVRVWSSSYSISICTLHIVFTV